MEDRAVRTKALALLAALILAGPARAVEVIIQAPTLAAMQQAAAAIGYATKNTDGSYTITPQGQIASGGSYFFNYVGFPTVPTGGTTTCTGPGDQTYSCPQMQTLTSAFARLRHNGDPALMPNPPAAVLTQYGITLWKSLPLGAAGALCWSSDGATCNGPAYLDSIGVIQ
jgi:hypothetical protein